MIVERGRALAVLFVWIAAFAPLAAADEPAAPADAPFFGNERMLLVANGASPASIAMARRYAELRHVPYDHLLVLDDVPGAAPGSAEPIGLDECRERILKPLLAWMKERRLEDEIDAIVYSCGFPHAVDVQGVTSRLPDFQHVGPTAALTGLTYYAREIVADDYSSIAFQFTTGPNQYAKVAGNASSNTSRKATPDEEKLWAQSRQEYQAKKYADAVKTLHQLLASASDFAGGWYDLACCEALVGRKDDALLALKKAVDAGYYDAAHASSDGDFESVRHDETFKRLLDQMREHTPKSPPGCGFGVDHAGRGHYYLSTIVAWIGPFGSSEADALAGLERDAAADASDPRGTFYFLKNGDVRATTREPWFSNAIEQLKSRGRGAELLAAGKDGQDGVLPKGKSDVLGAVVGISDFDWGACGSKIVPGAIVEHLTSCGGMLQAAGQTKLTAFLKAGAAGASGAVTEPYAIPAKFPSPLIHVYYADGCSLAEAFYQSVASPYQLLIVGDACCRPFAKLAKVELAADATKSVWSSTVTLEPKVANTQGYGSTSASACDHFEAWLDGALVGATSDATQPLQVDTTKVADGPHELHVVAIGPPPIGVPTAIVRRVTVANHAKDGLAATITGPSKPLELGKRVELSGRAPAGARFELVDGGRAIASGVALGGSWKVDLPSAALGLGKATLRVRATTSDGSFVSDSLDVTTLAPSFAGAASAPGELLPGLAVDVSSVDSKKDGGGSSGANRRVRRGTLTFSDALPMGDAAKDANATALVRGFLQLKAAGRHEWSFGGGDLRSLTIDGKHVVADTRPEKGESVAPVQGFALELANGWHSFELEIAAHGGHEPRLSLFGPNGAVAFDDSSCGQGPTGLRRVAKEKLVAKNAAWCDGDRTVAAPPEGDAAELEFKANAERVGAIAVHFVALGAAGFELEKSVAIETRDAGAWSPLPASDVRLLRSAPAGQVDDSVLLATAGGRKAKKIRVRAVTKDVALLKALAEVEIWEGAPKN